jgi:hypothetical protein
VPVLSYLQQLATAALPEQWLLASMLFIAGASNQLAAAQWLRAQGAEWPQLLGLEIDGELKQWEGLC